MIEEAVVEEIVVDEVVVDEVVAGTRRGSRRKRTPGRWSARGRRARGREGHDRRPRRCRRVGGDRGRSRAPAAPAHPERRAERRADPRSRDPPGCGGGRHDPVRAAPGHRDRQPEGRRGQDHDRREPRRRAGRARVPGAGRRPRPAGQRHHRPRASTPATSRARSTTCSSTTSPLEDIIEPTSLKNLFVAPATIDLAGAEIELVPAMSRELKLQAGASTRSATDYDLVLIDCPPSLGLLTVNGLAAADDVIVPIQCEYYALEGLGQLLRNVGPGPGQPEPDARRPRDRPHHVRRPHQARRPGGVTRSGPTSVDKVYQTVVPRTVRLVRGAVVRAADHRVRFDVARRQGVPRAGEGGEPWRDQAGWVRGSAPDPARRGRRPARRRSVGSRRSPSRRSSPTRTSRATTSTRRPSASLADSIREVGVLQPVLVRPAGDGYELIAGERRWRAARRVGLQTIPALVRETDDSTALEQALVENLHREELNPLEEAAAYQQLIEDFGLTHEQVAARVGRSRAAVSNTLRLLQLPPAIQRWSASVSSRWATPAPCSARPTAPSRRRSPSGSSPRSLSVRAVEEAVREPQRRGGDGGRSTATDRPPPGAGCARPGFVELEELLGDHLETRVKIAMGGRAGADHGRVRRPRGPRADLPDPHRGELTVTPSDARRRE